MPRPQVMHRFVANDPLRTSGPIQNDSGLAQRLAGSNVSFTSRRAKDNLHLTKEQMPLSDPVDISARLRRMWKA